MSDKGEVPIEHAAVWPLEEADEWAANLAAIAQEPLALCESFPLIAKRFEAWWEQSVHDRPLFVGSANTKPVRPLGRRLELLEDPTNWLEVKQRDLSQLHCVGEAIPSIRVDFGPVMLGQMFGGGTEVGSDTMWTHTFINDEWSNVPAFEVTEQTRWWSLLRGLFELVSTDASGKYVVCSPDLGGSADVLLNLRGSEGLCMDVIDQPERMIAAQEKIYEAWHRVYAEMYRITSRHRAGLMHWLGIWSNQPYLVPACDFNFMIGPDDFAKTCLPDIARQVATVGRGVFHLDGPGAAKHFEALCEVPGMKAIQYTPGAGTPSALAHVEMFRAIQAKGLSLYIHCPASEVLTLAEQLKPEGLAIWLADALPPKGLDELFEAFCRQVG